MILLFENSNFRDPLRFHRSTQCYFQALPTAVRLLALLEPGLFQCDGVAGDEGWLGPSTDFLSKVKYLLRNSRVTWLKQNDIALMWPLVALTQK